MLITTRSKLLFCIISFAIGITVGKLFNWGYFELSSEISIIDAISFFSTIGLAIYVTNSLEKKAQNRRVEKDLLLAKIAEIEACLTTLSETIVKPSRYTQITSLLKNCNKSTTIIFKTIKEVCIQVDAKVEDPLTAEIKELRKLCTESSIISTENTNIQIADGVVTYNNNRVIEIESVLDSMKINYFKLKFEVNKE